VLVKPLPLNNYVHDYVPMNWPHVIEVPELYGIEIELEGKGGITHPPPSVMAKWDIHQDNSLRKLNPGDEAIEYVTKIPEAREPTFQSVKFMMDWLNNPKLKVYDSYRTSIHVHVNCMADTLMTVCNFITLCIIFDELLVSQNGDHRIGNNFCLRSKDAEGQIIDLVKSMEMNGTVFGVGQNNRYSSINYASLNKFGTVEFRSLECTTDLLRIIHWIRTIDFIKQKAKTFENPQDVIRKFSQMSAQEFLFSILETCAPKYHKVLGYEDMLHQGMRLAQEFAYCSKWVVQDGPKKPVPKMKKAPQAFVDIEGQVFNQIHVQAHGADAVQMVQAAQQNANDLAQFIQGNPGQAPAGHMQGQWAAPPPPAPVQVDGWGDPIPDPDDDFFDDEPPMEDDDF